MLPRTFLLSWFLVQLSFRGIEGNYQVLVSVHSLVLLESRCGECYDAGGGEAQRSSCCDGNNTSSCPNNNSRCDILLRFCRLGDLSQFNLANRLLGTTCPQTPLSSHLEDFLGFNLKAGETYPQESLQAFSSPVMYDGTGHWKGAQLNIFVVDRDAGDDIDDLIDHFSIPINISAGTSLTGNFTGVYNYTQLELTIEVTCTAQNNTDEDCVCLTGFTGPLCELNVTNNCTAAMPCKNGGSCVAGSCSCSPGFTGDMCESDVPGMEMTTSSSTSSGGPAAAAVPVAAIAGGVVGGVLLSLILVILVLILALLVFRRRMRTKSFNIIQGSTTNNFDSSKVVLQSGDVHIYDDAAGNGDNKVGSEILKEFNNPIYGDDPEHEYEAAIKAHSDSKEDHSDQYQELERKFENPIYGDEDDEKLDNPIPVHESNIDYDQVGNVYHTLESEQDRQQRYAEFEAGHGGQETAAASVEVKDSSKGQTGKPQHSYEDVQ